MDPCEGLTDLLAGVLKTPIAPEESFHDDPLRMMRAARFVSQLGATVDPATLAAMRDMSARILDISAERVRDELLRMVSSDSPREGLEDIGRHGTGRACAAGIARFAPGKR